MSYCVCLFLLYHSSLSKNLLQIENFHLFKVKIPEIVSIFFF